MFYINNIAFKAPSNLPKKIVKRVSTRRSVDNTLTVDVIDFNEKIEMVWEYNLLTSTELDFLLSYNFGVYPVECTLAGYEFDIIAYIEVREYEESYAGYKKNIQVNIIEQ